MKFDLESCKALTSETRAQAIEADARDAAESHRDRKAVWREAPKKGLLWDGPTWMDQAHNNAEHIIWAAAFQKRKSRLDRMLDQEYFL
jgi:hypothetical protein